MQELSQFPELQEVKPGACWRDLFVQLCLCSSRPNHCAQRSPYVWCCQFFSLVYPCCPLTRPGLKSVGYLPESHPAVSERGRGGIKAKGENVAKGNGKASGQRYSRGAEVEEVKEKEERGRRMWWYGQNNKCPRERTFIDVKGHEEKQTQVKEGVRERGQTEQESYMQLELLQVNHIWLCHNCRWVKGTRSMHILNYTKDVVS